MRRSSRYAWGPLVLVAYIVLAVVATWFLAPLWVTRPEGSGSRYDAVVDVLGYWRNLLLVSLALLATFAGLGVVLLVVVGTLVDQVDKTVRALKHPKWTGRERARER